ncbi:MAG: hypothetical protein P4L40_01725 [Terracidiphilus sp.]|nr:hypothetical protein [Terracidiphilus sp.]
MLHLCVFIVRVFIDFFSPSQWKCSAELPSNLAFGTTTVSCEGYDGPEDAYILRGSCGLEYTLNRVAPAAGGSGARPSWLHL